MGRIMINGGLWKNTNDEILKVAVMKYGKNQWARISSLLVRKSAKQCKSRWYEWLNPSINKTEWSGEEDEKLLHLAKLMPTQWRTIAPIVGRTPSQCLERYEKLLDAACSCSEDEQCYDDPRKLRPGEIDPNPESKPARPDPVDMDEDEKEMLSEARGRLANTRGKKAKRKAREKQLEEARRLASLQKRRELKAAGIGIGIDLPHKKRQRKRKRKRGGIDYNAEIPFEKRPPPGFYDIGDEDRPAELVKFPTTIEELEGERRVDKEARLRKHDSQMAQRQQQQQQDAPSAINKLNDPGAVQKRPRLNLPSPQIPAMGGISSDLIRLTPMRDESIDMHDHGKLRQSHTKKQVISGLKNLPQPNNDYQIVIQPLGDEEPDEKIEEDMSDRVAREKAEEAVQRELPRPPVASLDLITNSLMRTDEDHSSFVPPTLLEHADELVRNELLSLLEHDNIKYPLEKKKGGKHSASELQNEFRNVKKKMDDEINKAQRHEQKIQVVTNGYQMRANKLWAQVEATFKQMDAAGTQVECFRALKKQETLSATHRITNLWEELQKQKDLERTLQKRYADRLTELERVQHLVNAYRLQAEREDVNAVKDRDSSKSICFTRC